MGATLRQREIDTEQPSQMDKLFVWIRQVRTKKMKWLRNRRRNIRIEAVLAHALCHAENQLRDRQIARIHRWQQLKEEMLQKAEEKQKDGCQVDKTCDADTGEDWSEALCPELSSLDSFMSDLSKIKAPLQR